MTAPVHDQRAHERLDSVEKIVVEHIKEHTKFEAALAENVRVSTETAKNTGELVEILRGVKGLRSFVVWAAPLAVCVAAVWHFIRTH